MAFLRMWSSHGWQGCKMRKPGSVESLETLGRVRLSDSFFMRDFLYSEIANFYGIPNIPDDPDLAIEVGRNLCNEILEPLQERLWADFDPFGLQVLRCQLNRPGIVGGPNS